MTVTVWADYSVAERGIGLMQLARITQLVLPARSIRGVPVAAVVGNCVTIVKVRLLADVESDFMA